MKNVFTWDALKRTDYFVDYQNLYTFCGVLSQRQLFVNVAKEMMKIGDKERAVEMLDMCQECVPEENYPLDMTYLGFTNEYMVLDMINLYYEAGENDKARELSEKITEELMVSMVFFMENYDYAKREMESCYVALSDIADMADYYGDKELASLIEKYFDSLLSEE